MSADKQKPAPAPGSSAGSSPTTPLPEVGGACNCSAAMPKHIAIIMDGNGRWAIKQNKPRIFGHQNGAKAVRAVVTECAKLELEALTLYSFSMENWKRPADEVNALMELYCAYLQSERKLMMDNNIKFVQIGRTEGLPEKVVDQLEKTRQTTASNTGMTLAVALNYGSRSEITDTVRSIAKKVKDGKLSVDDINEQLITDNLYTAGLPDPDLLIRTAGEMRISNFLLWQISYTELWVTQELWPDFTVEHLHDAIKDYAHRQRRFGAVTQ